MGALGVACSFYSLAVLSGPKSFGFSLHFRHVLGVYVWLRPIWRENRLSTYAFELKSATYT